jgi:hypothetical protein
MRLNYRSQGKYFMKASDRKKSNKIGKSKWLNSSNENRDGKMKRLGREDEVFEVNGQKICRL